MVRLLQAAASRRRKRISCFNPTMVRLLQTHLNEDLLPSRVSIPQWCDCCENFFSLKCFSDKFQSHNGAIAAFNGGALAISPILFQSHNGAIAATRVGCAIAFSLGVSIPQWCDCCPTCDTNSYIQIVVSIPQWCDCCPCAS